MRKAKFLENTPEAHLGQINGKASAKNPLEIHAAPARNSIPLRIRTGLHEAPQFLHLFLRKLRGAARGFDVAQAVGASLIEAMPPIAQSLGIHPANPRRLLT